MLLCKTKDSLRNMPTNGGYRQLSGEWCTFIRELFFFLKLKVWWVPSHFSAKMGCDYWEDQMMPDWAARHVFTVLLLLSWTYTASHFQKCRMNHQDFVFMSCIKVPVYTEKTICKLNRSRRESSSPDACLLEIILQLWSGWNPPSARLLGWERSRSCSGPLLSCLLAYLYSEISLKGWRLCSQDAERAWGWSGLGGSGQGDVIVQIKGGEGQAWSSMGKTKRVPRLSSSCSRESSSRSSASSEVLPLLLPFALQLDPESAPPPLPDAPLAVMAVSPNMKVRSLSLWIRSESWSLSCSWFWKHIQSGTKRWGMENTHRWRTHRVGICGVNRLTSTVQRLIRGTMELQKEERGKFSLSGLSCSSGITVKNKKTQEATVAAQ